MLTRSGWTVIAGIAAGIALGRLLGVTELYVLATVAGALVLLALVWVRRPVPRLTVHRHISPPQVSAGSLGRVEVSLTNHGPRRLPPIVILDPVEGTIGARMAVGPLAAGARQDVGYRLPPLQRGQLHIGPLTTEVVDPFGLARRRLPGVAELALTVLPAIDPAPLLPLGGGRHEPLAGLSRRIASASGVADLVTLRPYVVGDDLRRVHWPSTAHADELQVRRDEDRWQGHIAVLLDTRAHALGAADFERAVSAAAGVVDAVAASGDRVRLTTTSGMDSGMVDALRAGHGLLEDLALVRQDRDQPLSLPMADLRRPVSLLVLTGGADDGLPAAARDAGFADLVIIRFADGPTADASVVVASGEPFAEAWGRAAAVAGQR
ncbi:DUF58 domain-containing protein [Aquihabitans daechungensis]|uniref:DUF58 domain-containing protein n=1 Tax=Aquihabitans daechungensis TaxID=1052257 RepID=UPI003BA28042